MPSQDMKIMHLLPHKGKRTENTQSNVLVRQLPELRSSKTPSPRQVTARPAKGRCSALASFHGARSQTSFRSSFVSSSGIADSGAGIADVADGRAAVLRRTGHTERIISICRSPGHGRFHRRDTRWTSPLRHSAPVWRLPESFQLVHNLRVTAQTFIFRRRPRWRSPLSVTRAL